jgi:hypothetical protein
MKKISSGNRYRRQLDYIIGQIGYINASINYAKQFKLNPVAQADIIRLNGIKKVLENKLKKLNLN